MAIEDPSIALAFDFECAEIYQEFQNERELEKRNSDRAFLYKILTGEDL